MNNNDKLIRLDEVLSEIGLKKTPFYSMIKEFDEAYKTEQNEKIKEEIFSIYILIKQKKIGRTSLWSYNQIQQLISLIKNGEVYRISNYIRYKNVA